jgi:replicative DNA helicase
VNSDKLPPHDIDAEEAVIGSLLIDGSAIYKVTSLLQPSDFYSERNSLVYQACLSLYERNDAINQITVAQELARQNKLDTCGGAAYLSHLIAICPTSLDIEDYGQIVCRLSLMRRLITAADKIAAIGYKADPDVDASLDKAEDALYQLRHGQSPRDFVHIRRVLEDYFESTASATGTSHESTSYVLSGFTGLDELLGGFHRSDLIVFAGRPSHGKTSLGLNISRNAAVDYGKCVAFFSLEMSREEVVLRLLSGESEVNSRRIRFDLLNEDEERRVMTSTGRLSEASMYIDDSPLIRVAEMRSKARRLYYEHGLDLIVVDYLQLMQGDSRPDNRVLELGYICRSLKALAREFSVPVIVVSQLSRAIESRPSHKPQLSDLRESGNIEQDADVVIFISREELYTGEEEWRTLHEGENYPPPAEIIIAKHRNGPIGETHLHFKRSLAKFENLSIGHEEPSLL